MVGLKSGSIWRRLFGPSRAERAEAARFEERQLLLRVLSEERAAAREAARLNADLMGKVLDGISANSNSFAQWMKMIGSAGENRVRIMTDELEAVQETDRVKAMRDAFQPLRSVVEAPVAIPMSNVETDHALLMQDLFS